MSIQHFLAIIRARWAVALSVLMITVLTSLVVSLSLPKRYLATGELMLDLRSNDPIAGFVYGGMIPPSYLGTQVDVIKSERVAKRVVKALKLDQAPAMRQQWQDASKGQGSFDSWMAELMLGNLVVKPSRESNVIEVSYQAVDPQFAAALSNAFMQAYIEVVLEMRVEPAKQYAAMFEEQSRTLRTKLEAAQTKLSDFQRDKGLIATDERFDIENARLNELSTQLVMIQALANDSSSKQAQIGSNAERMQEVLTNPVIGGLKAEIAREEAQLKEIQARLGDAHPQVLALRASVGELRTKLDTETKRITGGLTVNSNVNKSREVQARVALEQQRQKVLHLKEIRDDASVLVRDVDNLQKAYDNLVAKLNQSSLESQANQTNISILKQASPPNNASFPKVWLNIALALVLGIVLSAATALAIEMADRRLRTDDDVIQAFGVQIIGSLPDVLYDGKNGESTPPALGRRAAGLIGLNSSQNS